MNVTLSNVALALVLGAGLGAAHGLETDHLAEITAQVVRKGGDGVQAFLLGAIFGLGHVLTTIAFGVVGLVLGWVMPQRLGAFFDRLVGPMVLGVGIWALVVALRRLRHPAHDHHHHHQAHGGLRHRLAHLKDQMLLGGLFALNPAPEAIAIFLVMMPGGHLESMRGLGGWQLGLLTLLGFGLGIALVMGCFGVLVQRSLRLASRLGGAIARWTPVVAGTLILLVGTALSLKG